MSTGSNSLTVTTSSTASGTLTLAGGGSTAFTVGGSFPISTATSSGAYTGSLVVTVAYN
jgi:spore coat protein U-like protein